MTSSQLAELKAIAVTLAIRSNDPAAMQRFNVFVRSIGQSARRDLVVVLQEMITDARRRQAEDAEPICRRCEKVGSKCGCEPCGVFE